MTTLRITTWDVQQDMENSAHGILQLKCGQYTSEQSLDFHALMMLWKVGIEHSGPILDLISVRLSDAAHRNINEKCALFL